MKPLVNSEYFEQFLVEFDYPESARKSILEDYNKILLSHSIDAFNLLISEYDKNINCDFSILLKKMEDISNRAQVHKFAGILILFIALSKRLKEYYAQQGVNFTIYKDSVLDLKYKSQKCFNIYGVWGWYSAWFVGFFQMTRFAFGKLEFEMSKFRHNFEIDGLTLTPDSDVINIHIPNTGSPLDKESMDYAFNRAKEFFKEKFSGDKVVFVCNTWLLFKKHKQILKPESNLVKFIDCFTIVEEGFYPDYEETWRLFGTKDLSDFDKLPQKTSLQRAYVEMMKKGEKTGWAYGVFTL